MAIIALETEGTFDPSMTNNLGYTGLIQIGKDAAKDLNTTTDKLRKMTVVEQLNYVEKYLDRYKSKLRTITDIYLSVLYPKACGHGEEKNYVVFDDSKKAYRANPTFFYEDDEVDKDSKGKITKRHGKTGGKTYIWEVKMAIQSWYSKGTAKMNTCKKDASTCEFGTNAGEYSENNLKIPKGIAWLETLCITMEDRKSGTDFKVSYANETNELRTELNNQGEEKMDCSELVSRFFQKIEWSEKSKYLTTKDIYSIAENHPEWLEKHDSMDYKPKKGDIFLWKTIKNGMGHTGVVVDYNPTTDVVTTIEAITGNHTANENSKAFQEKSGSYYKFNFGGIIKCIWKRKEYHLLGHTTKGGTRTLCRFYTPKTHYTKAEK